MEPASVMQPAPVGLTSSLTSHAAAALAAMTPESLDRFVQMAGALIVPDAHLLQQQQERENTSQRLLGRLQEGFERVSQENARLQAALEASERRSIERTATLEAGLQEAVATAQAIRSASAAQAQQHQDQIAALNQRVDALSNLHSDRIAALTGRVAALEGNSKHYHTYTYTQPTGCGCVVHGNTATSGPLYPK